MARLFISHSSANNAAAKALSDWLAEQGYDDIFLDIDPERGLVAGQRWQEALKAAADRCEAVLFLVSPAWLRSRWCVAEFLLAKSLHKLIFGLIVEPVPLDQVPPEMTAEWQLCELELVGEDRLRSFDVEVLGRAARIAFREAGLDLLRRGLERAGLDAKSFPWPPRDEPNRAPYRGLKALEPQDAAIFFGRDAWIVRGLDRIRGLTERGIERMLVILGASGSGKSSFLRAGLWPRLQRDDLNFLPLPVVRPQTTVISGTTGLAASLAGAFARLGEARPPGRVREVLAADGAIGFSNLLHDLSVLAQRRHIALPEPPTDPAVVLPLDQTEELYNIEGGTEATVFIDWLSDLLSPEGTAPRLFVVATMRSDRFELVQNDPRLETIKRDLFDLPPIPPAEFKSVIEGPARRVAEAGGRLTIDPALSERLIGDAAGADALPLLGFTLERLNADYGAEGRLTLAEYETLGGVQGSIEAAVAAALAEPGRAPSIAPDPETQIFAMRAAFIPWLARIDPASGLPMRRVADRSEIPEGSRSIVDRLVEARLLIADRRRGVDVVEIAHESLLRQWPTLTAWLDADAADLRAVEGIEHAAAEWVRNGCLDAWLDHRGDRLAQANHLVARTDFSGRLYGDCEAYLTACRTRQEAEQQREEAERYNREIERQQVEALNVANRRPRRMLALAILALAVLVRIIDPVPVQQLRLAIFDREQALVPRQPLKASPVRIVQIDDDSIVKYGQWPWPRTLLATLIEKIAEAKPKVLAISILFTAPDRTSPPALAENRPDLPTEVRDMLARLPSNDSRMAAAIAKVPTVLAVKLVDREVVRPSSGDADLVAAVPHYTGAIESIREIAQAAKAVGSVSVEPDVDGVFRRLSLVAVREGGLVPGFAVAALDVATGVPAVPHLRARAGGLDVTVGHGFAPADRTGAAWMYFGPQTPFYPAMHLLDGSPDLADLTDRIVLLAVTSGGTGDLQRTPLGLMYGIEFQAQWIDALLSGQLLSRPAYAVWVELAALLLGGLAMVWLVRYDRPLLAAVLSAAAVAVLLVGEFALFRFADLLVDGVYPAIATLAAFGAMLQGSLGAAQAARRAFESLEAQRRRVT